MRDRRLPLINSRQGSETVDHATAGGETHGSLERLVWWLFAGSTGGHTRLLVLRCIRREPRNARQLSHDLGVDYTTVRHHLRVLEANRLVIAEGGNYGRVYFISEKMESHWDKLEIINKRKPSRTDRTWK